MNPIVSDTERDVERVARALFARGSRVESLALLRGAVARDPEQARCVALLQTVTEQGPPSAPPESSGVLELDLALVDRWIRAGMLVEALALLSGTPMGSLETGREWAQLLGELLAPVPVDAEPVMASMHRQLLTGGASVAMSLLEDRAKETPPPAAWALRRLELLRWMLLDNAAPAEEAPRLPEEVPSLLAGAIRGGIHQRNFHATVEGARAFCRQYPASPDAARTLVALEALAEEVAAHSGGTARHRTMPVFGRPAAALQLRMCNLSNAASVYRRLLSAGHDPEVSRLSEHVTSVLRALAGEAVDPPGERGDPSPFDEEDDLVTQLAGLARSASGESSANAVPGGPLPGMPVSGVPMSGVAGVAVPDVAATEQMPAASEQVLKLIQEGRLEEARQIQQALASLFDDAPTDPLMEAEEADTPPDGHATAAPPTRVSGTRPAPPAMPARSASPKDPEGVVVRKIRPIE